VDGSPASPRDPFLQVVRDCMTPSPDALAASVLPGATPTDSLAIAPATDSLADARRPTTADACDALTLTSDDGHAPYSIVNVTAE